MAERLPNGITVEKNIPFSVHDRGELKLDLYLPRDPPAPVVVYLHGGGWVAGDRAEGDGRRMRAMAERGVAVAAIDYRLAPTARHPAQLHDVFAAIAWLRATGDQHGLATERIGVWGASAGGYLATMAGLLCMHLSSERVDAVISWFSLGDMAASVHRTPLERIILPQPFEAALLGIDGDIGPDDLRVREASPLSWTSEVAVPFLLAHGDRDQVVPEAQGRALHEAIVRAGGDSTFLVVGGAGHEDPAFDDGAVIDMSAAWLRDRLRP